MAPIISALSGLYKSLLYTSSGFSASGGTIDDTSVTGYTIHTFDTVGPMSFSVNGDASIDLAVIGAGGGGGWNWGAGGGAGGVVVARDLPVTTGSYAITIGGHPGTRSGPGSDLGEDGSPSTFVHTSGTFTGLGGGGGGYAGAGGRPGGSGGGVGNPGGPGTAGTGTQPAQPQPSGAGIVSNYGWPGASLDINANAFNTPHSGDMQPGSAGSGGGGAGGQGKFSIFGSTASSRGGSGGTGVYLGGLFGDNHPGLDDGYAAGGGGGRGQNASPLGDTTPGGGGYGGKGGGGDNNSTASNHDGYAYGGAGAGNSGSDNISGLGHKGAVLIRYKTVEETFTAATGGTVLTKGNYKYHIYTSTGNGTFNVSSLGTDKMIDILVVAGGGGGTHPYGAGAGAGGVVFTEGYPLPATGTYNLRVGAGGVSATGNTNHTSGSPSAFGTTSTSSPYPAYSLVAIGGGRGNNQDARTPSPGGSGGGAEGNPGTSQIGGVGIQTRTTNTNAFLPQTSRWSGHGTTGGKGNPQGQYGAGGGGAWGTDVQSAGDTDNRAGMGMVVPDGFLPQPFAPWMPGKSQFLGMPISGNALGLRMFGAGGSGGPSGNGPMRNFGGGGGGNLGPTGETTSNGFVAQPTDPGSGLAGRGGGGAGSNSDSNAMPGGGGSGSIIIRYKYQNS